MWGYRRELRAAEMVYWPDVLIIAVGAVVGGLKFNF